VIHLDTVPMGFICEMAHLDTVPMGFIREMAVYTRPKWRDIFIFRICPRRISKIDLSSPNLQKLDRTKIVFGSKFLLEFFLVPDFIFVRISRWGKLTQRCGACAWAPRIKTKELTGGEGGSVPVFEIRGARARAPPRCVCSLPLGVSDGEKI